MNLNYYEEKGLLNSEGTRLLKGRIMSVNDSVCAELLGHLQEYGVKERQVLDFFKAENPDLQEVSDSLGYTCNLVAYKDHSIEALLKQHTILLEDTNNHCVVVTNSPDVPQFLADATSSVNSSSVVVALATQDIWNVLVNLFIEPEIIKRRAAIVSETEEEISKGDKAADSESRQLYRKLLNIGLDRNASDIHFLPCSTCCQVLYRVDGKNEFYGEIPLKFLGRIRNIICTDADISELSNNKPLDGKLSYSPSNKKVPNDEIDLRVSLIEATAGWDINIRVLSSKMYTFEDLGMTPKNVDLYKSILNLNQGMVIQVGPTGSGKSTTLYSGLNYIHQSLRNILTAEDPVEIKMDGIMQVSIDESKGVRFSDVLKAFLRHDPDVAVVGELRDHDTAEEALRQANTGHLILTSLHTNDAISTMERLVNMGIDPYSIGEVLVAVMGQRLVRRLCPYCKRKVVYQIDDPYLKDFHLKGFVKDKEVTVYEPVGCAKCRNIGYRSRVAANEILTVDRQMRYLIQSRSKRREYEKYLKASKFQTIYADAVGKVLDGTTSLEEIRELATDATAFKGWQYDSVEEDNN